MIAARIVSYIVEYTAPVWHRRHVDSRPRRAIHPPISPYHRHQPRIVPLVRPLNGRAKPPPWCSIIDTYPSRRLAFPGLLRASPAVAVRMHLESGEENATARRTLMKIVDPYIKKNCVFYKKRYIPPPSLRQILFQMFSKDT